MSIQKLLLARKKIVHQSWFDILVGNYPPETTRLLKKETNQFANPVGQTFSTALEDVLEEFLQENSYEKVTSVLDRIIRIRAVQDFTPSRGLAFIFLLKRIAREQLAAEIANGRIPPEELAEFDERVDGLALAAMDVYAKCRDTLYEVRIREIKDRTQRLLQRADIIAELPPLKPEEKQ